MSREPEIRKDILISVVVPVYNAEKDIERCVKSLLAQSHENMEIILIDDGSLDSSGTICDELARNPGVQVYHQENAGSSAARNTGIQKAKGDYIGFCDSDDYVEKDMYENLLAAATEHPEGKIFQIMTFYETESGEVLEGPKQDSGNVNFIPSEEDFRLLMLHRGDASFCTKLLPLSFMKEYAFPVGKLNEDFELLIRLLQATDGVYNVEKPGYHIVLSDQSNTRGTFKREFYDAMIANSDEALRLAEEKYPEAITEAERFCFFQRLDYLLHIPVKEMKDNPVCDGIIEYLKKNKKKIRENPYLSGKEKKNLRILMNAPRLSKRVHGLIMRIKKPGKPVIYTGAQT